MGAEAGSSWFLPLVAPDQLHPGEEVATAGLHEAPLSGEVTRQGSSVLRARIHPPIEHAGAGTPPHGLRVCHTGANDQPSLGSSSPKKSPGCSSLPAPTGVRTATAPSMMMKNESPGSPICVTTVPAGTSTILESSAPRRSSSIRASQVFRSPRGWGVSSGAGTLSPRKQSAAAPVRAGQESTRRRVCLGRTVVSGMRLDQGLLCSREDAE